LGVAETLHFTQFIMIREILLEVEPEKRDENTASVIQYLERHVTPTRDKR
jgi:hypothetical protein